ncbi:hypothetical protein D3C83_230990 [compost metagenome]
MKDTVNNPITRPRMWSSTMVWMMVETPIATVSAARPTTPIIASDRTNDFE